MSLLALAAALAITASTIGDADACGGFFSRAVRHERRPSLAYEQVLLIHDPRSETQHFIREVAFRRANEPFGFVVPTPSRPTVAKVNKSPFVELRQAFPFTPPRRDRTGLGYGSGGGRLGGGSGGGVKVLEVTKVGSFTAFVLAASDEKALGKWLADNGFTSTPETDEWLAHYVRLKFYYVAMRYEPSSSEGDAVDAVKAETTRISFATPLPYYPYLEPRPPAALPTSDRVLDLWLVRSAAVVPVAMRELDGKRGWIRPLRAGHVYPNARESLLAHLEPELERLLPSGELSLQTFQDQKFSRQGIGDVLFAPMTRSELTPAQRRKLEPLLGLLDPELVKETP